MNFFFPAHDGVHFALLGNFRQIPAKSFQGRGFHVFAFFFRSEIAGHGSLGFLGRREIRIQLRKNFVATAIHVHVQRLQNPGGDPLPFPKETKKNVLRPHVTVIQSLGLFASQSKNLFDSRSVGNVAGWFGFRSETDLFVHGLPDRVEIKTHLLQNVDGNTLAKVNQSEKQVLGSHIVVMKTIRFLPCKGKHLLGSRGEITHWLRHNSCISVKTSKVNLPKATNRSEEPD